MVIRKICIVGGTGFVGRHLAAELARHGYSLKVLTRRRERRRELLVIPTLELIEANVHQSADLREQFQGCDAVINLAGILNETSGAKRDFGSVHTTLPSTVADACRMSGVKRLLHMSALKAAADAPSQYLRSKHAGEEAAHAAAEHGVAVTSFRPSVIFGADDSFFNRFATLLALPAPIFPLACPESRFAPVYVGDVARAFAVSLSERATFAKRYELCGPHIYTLRELVEYTARLAGRRRLVVGLGDRAARLQASVLQHLPGKPFSMDNYLSLQVDSVCEHGGLRELGIEPTSVESVVPSYIGRGGRTGLYNSLRSIARRGAA